MDISAFGTFKQNKHANIDEGVQISLDRCAVHFSNEPLQISVVLTQFILNEKFDY